MSKILLSDWTLIAFQQREEERRRREQDIIAPLLPDEAAPSAKETLRSEWTILALQKRFAALEQRLAALEQREEERRQVEFAAAARIHQKDAQVEALLATSTIVDPGQDNQREPGIEQAEYVRAESESRDAGPLARVDDQSGEQNVLRARRDGNGDGEPIDKPTARKGGFVYAMFYRLVSITVTASIAAAIGFGIAVVAVPIEKAAQFHSVVNRMIDRASFQK